MNITLLTHWATCMAQWRAKIQNNNNADATDLSYDVFSTIAGVAIREVEPLNITDPNNASADMSDGLQYGIYTAAISSLTKDLAERSGLDPHTLTSTTSIHLAQIGCNDIRADGKLDGQGFTGDDTQISPLGFGTVPLTPRVYRTEVAQHMLTVAGSDLNKTGLDAADYLARAQSLSTLDSDVFDKITPESVDLEGPVISIDAPANTFLKGNIDLDFSINDPLGIKRIEFYVDNNLVFTNAGDSTLFSLDTTCCNYADGPHEIKVLAYDALDNESTFVRTYNFDNSGPIVTANSPTLVNNISYVATGTYQLEGADIKAILVNGSPATLDTVENTWTSIVSLTPGNNTIAVQAEDANNNFSSELVFNVAVDTKAPELRNSDNTGIQTSAIQSLYADCENGTMELINVAALCIPDNRISLNGKQISVDLLGDSYTLIAYQINDTPVDSVFTPEDQLKIEYKVEKNGSLFQDWKTAPARNPDDTDWFLPLTSEYLGDSWFQTSRDSVFIITFRVTDLAGNITIDSYTMSFNISPSEIATTTALPNETIFTTTTPLTPFDSRLGVDGKNFNVKYTYVNDSSVGYYFFLDDSTSHSVEHSYESVIRKNRARINSQEHWQVKYFYRDVFGRPQLSDWTVATSLIYWSENPDSTIISPISNIGDFINYTQDIVTKPVNTSWSVASIQTYCEAPNLRSNNSIYFFNLIDLNGAGAACAKTGSNIIDAFNFQKRIAFAVEYQSGYPKNESNITRNPSINFTTNSIKLFIDTTSTEIIPTASWYLIPANTTVRIEKTIRMPALIHYNDLDVGDMTTFSSYTERRLDKSTTWNIDTDINVTRVVDPNDATKINDQTPTVQTIGDGIKTYVIER